MILFVLDAEVDTYSTLVGRLLVLPNMQRGDNTEICIRKLCARNKVICQKSHLVIVINHKFGVP